MSAPDDLPRLPPLETAEEHVLPLRQVLEARALLLTRQHPGNELGVLLSAMALGAALATARASEELYQLRLDMEALRR